MLLLQFTSISNNILTLCIFCVCMLHSNLIHYYRFIINLKCCTMYVLRSYNYIVSKVNKKGKTLVIMRQLFSLFKMENQFKFNNRQGRGVFYYIKIKLLQF